MDATIIGAYRQLRLDTCESKCSGLHNPENHGDIIHLPFGPRSIEMTLVVRRGTLAPNGSVTNGDPMNIAVDQWPRRHRIEVSDSTLKFDRGPKLALYAKHAIPEVWVIDLVNNQLHCMREPQNGQYVISTSLTKLERIAPLMFPTLQIELAPLFD
jgi:hypothetical protein